MSPRAVKAVQVPGQLEFDYSDPVFTDEQRAELAAHVLPGWARMAACGGAGDDTWFPESGCHLLTALTTCADCPVRRSCLAAALAENEEHGVWGGTTEVDRYAIKQRISVGVPVPEALSPALVADRQVAA